jgi:hypothetical protein
MPFRNAGYVLPNTADNRERLIWAGTSVRGHGGEASVLEIQTIDDLPGDALQRYFLQAREPEYNALREEIESLTPGDVAAVHLTRLKRKLEEIISIDFFESPLRAKVRNALDQLEAPKHDVATAPLKLDKNDYQKKAWLTRPRPGIDRVSSAWLIRRFIDPKAKFLFAGSPEEHSKAIPFDMFGDRGFRHVDDRCTFESLCISFDLREKSVTFLAEAIHDADLEDGKFGRPEGATINQILKGWAKQELPDEVILSRGMELVEGLYQSLQ